MATVLLVKSEAEQFEILDKCQAEHFKGEFTQAELDGYIKCVESSTGYEPIDPTIAWVLMSVCAVAFLITLVIALRKK